MSVPGAQPLASSTGIAWPEHLARLGESWAVWRWVFLRGAGFPLSRMLRLADRGCAAAADRLLDARSAVGAGREVAPAAEAQAAASAYELSFGEAVERLAGELEGVARDELFREALVWHNRCALETGVEPFLRQRAEGATRSSKARRRERLITSYLQRYCTKNETTGFFGPMGWARWASAGQALDVRCEDRLLAERKVFFSHWAIDALAEAMAAEPGLQEWQAPWKLPFFPVDGGLCRPPGGSPWPLGAVQRAVYEACDGRTPARRIAGRLLADPELALGSRDEVYGVLLKLESLGLVRWRLQVPLLDLEPERVLRRQLEVIEDEALRSALLGRLDELESKRAAVSEAAGDGAALDAAFRDLEGTFTALTGLEPRRFGGRMFASRTLVHEECRRGVEMELGPQLLDRLGPPLALILQSARWLSHEIARNYRGHFRRAYEELRKGRDAEEVEMLSFFRHVGPLLAASPGRPSPVGRFFGELQERWLDLLDLPEGRRRVDYRVEDLAPRVRERFASPRPGWSMARHHSVDTLISADSVDAVRRGDYQLVLGEVHPAAHLMRSIMLTLHPDLEGHRAALAWDLPDPIVVLVPPKLKEKPDGSNPLGASGNSGRLDWGYVNPHDYELIISADPPTFERETIAIGELRVVERDGELRAVSLDGRIDMDLLDFCGSSLTGLIIDDFGFLPAREHLPRIRFDHLVVQRETWRLPLSGLRLKEIQSEADGFLEVRRWAREHDLPRFVFAHSPIERKPYFMDFDSPPCIALLLKAARDLARRGGESPHLTLSEMLPDPDHAWLQDASGQRYTSELRMVILDLTGRPPGGQERPARDAGEEVTS